MVRLDSDGKLLSLNGRTARRDIVPFVEFSRFAGNGPALAGELLAEMPGQALQHFKWVSGAAAAGRQPLIVAACCHVRCASDGSGP